MPSAQMSQHRTPAPSQPTSPRQCQSTSSEDSSAYATAQSPPDTRSNSTSFPFSFIRTSQAKHTSTSIAPSTAEGKAIPIDNSTVENRTTALRELNSHYPRRHRYEKSTGAQSSTYSEPVIVRSYYSPAPSRPPVSSRGGQGAGVVVHSSPRPKSQSGSSVNRDIRSLPFVTTVVSAGNGVMSRMPRLQQEDNRMSRTVEEAHTQLPPIEAFTFKSFIANVEVQSGSTSDINADLDRIAEICAKSRYSLSNQYEVHYAPHGSGSSFLGVNPRTHAAQGPTLQAVNSDDEGSLKRQTRRRNGARRNSRAMGTLETIMSSSRSSDDERSKKKSAAEMAEEIRGHAARQSAGHVSSAGSSTVGIDNSHSLTEAPRPATPSKRKASLALIDGQAFAQVSNDSDIMPHSSTTGLVSELALPQASTSQLELRTSPERLSQQASVYKTPKKATTTENFAITVAEGSMSSASNRTQGNNLLSTLGGWLPWLSTDSGPRHSSGRAEGSLRQLLQTTTRELEGKGLAGGL